MRVLTSNDCHSVSGGNPALLAIGAASVAGGALSSYLVASFPATTTFFGTIGGGLTGGLLCLPVIPPLGSIVCGTTLALGGYGLSTTLGPVAAFFGGGIMTGAGTYLAMAL